eukprot:1891890-Prymnesium_polylepis.2
MIDATQYITTDSISARTSVALLLATSLVTPETPTSSSVFFVSEPDPSLARSALTGLSTAASSAGSSSFRLPCALVLFGGMAARSKRFARRVWRVGTRVARSGAEREKAGAWTSAEVTCHGTRTHKLRVLAYSFGA